MDNKNETIKNFARDPKQDAALKAAAALSPEDLFAAIAITQYRATGFIPTEIIVTLVRRSIDQPESYRGKLADVLNSRLHQSAASFIAANSDWPTIYADPKRHQKDLVQELWCDILDQKAEVSFPEVRFGDYFNKKAFSYFRKQFAAKNSAPGIEDLELDTEPDIEFNGSLVDQIEDENSPSPEQIAEFNDLKDKAELAVRKLPKNLRDAIYFFYECGYPIRGEPGAITVSNLMGKTPRMIQNYLREAETLLQGALK